MKKLFWAVCLLWWFNAIGFLLLGETVLGWGALVIAIGVTLYTIVRQRREAALLVEWHDEMRNLHKALERKEREKS